MRVVVTESRHLNEATAFVRDVVDDIGAACDRFSPDSEVNRLRDSLPGGVEVSSTLALLVRTAVNAALLSDGDVDPTLGDVLSGLGYDRSFDELDGHVDETPAGVAVTVASPRVPGWQRIRVEGNVLTVPGDLRLDLGATAKALAADLAAARVAAQLGCGVLVSLGGDIATAGTAPEGGWQITVCDLPGDPECQITLAAGQALATSSTQKRRWLRDGRALHHIVDPSSGLPAKAVWNTVTVAGQTCVRANTLSTASVVRGYRAIAWLARRGAAARLVTTDRRVLTLGGWPDDNSVHVVRAG